MTDNEFEDWDEWLELPQSRMFLKALEARGTMLKQLWMDGLWSEANPDAGSAQYMDIRARANVYEELSKTDRAILTELLSNAKHNGN